MDNPNSTASGTGATTTNTQREQFERLSKESRSLKLKTELLEKENQILKKSIFDLSVQYNLIAYLHQIRPPTTLDILAPSSAAASAAPHLFNTSSLTSTAADPVILPPAPDHGSSTQPVLPPPSTPTPISTTQSNLSHHNARDKHKDSKYFTWKSDLKGHAGAVYTVQFSPCGRFLASGSFDKTVRIWDSFSTTTKEIHVLKRHTLNISEVSWSNTSRQLVSGAYDQTCKLWDTEAGKYVQSYECDGFVQCVQFNRANDHIFVNACTRNSVGIVDTRDQGSQVCIRTDAMVNSVHVYTNGSYLLTGDAVGMLKLYDIRHTNTCVDSLANDLAHKPISNIAVSRATDDDEPRYLACNSYDNVIRVYDRGFAPPQSHTKLLHSLKGHKNKNWPIKSAFYNCGDFSMSTFPRIQLMSESMDPSTDMGKSADEPAMLLATGSADPFAYLYAVGMSEGQTEMVQRLEGHSDRVYAVAFHPTDPILATCSADFSIKIWSSTGKGRQVATL